MTEIRYGQLACAMARKIAISGPQMVSESA
jgi:hypothetical protein